MKTIDPDDPERKSDLIKNAIKRIEEQIKPAFWELIESIKSLFKNQS